jgi:uncharacterized coiled-coil protein SlyX
MHHDPSSDQELQATYLQSLEAVYRRISNAAKAQGQLHKDAAINVLIGNRAVYKRVPGQKPVKNTMTPEQVSLLQKALDGPQNIQGSVRVSIGKQTVYHVKNGVVKTDTLSLAPVQTAIQAAKPVEPQRVDVQSTEAPPSLETLHKEVADLKATVDQQQQALDALTQRLEKLTSSIVPVKVKNPMLSHWFNTTATIVAEAAHNLAAKASEKIRQAQEPVTEKAQNFQRNVAEKGRELQAKAIRGVQTSIMDLKGRAINAAVSKMLKHVGKEQPDGSRIFESQNYQFRQHRGTIAIAAKDGRGEIYKDGQLSASASEKDVAKLDEVQAKVKQQFEQPQLSQTASGSPSHKR